MIIPVPYLYPDVYDSSTRSQHLPVLSNPYHRVLPIPSSPTVYYKSTQMPNIPSLISARVLKRSGTSISPHASRILPDVIREYYRRYARALPPCFDMVSSSHRSCHLPMLCPTSPRPHSLSAVKFTPTAFIFRWAYATKHMTRSTTISHPSGVSSLCDCRPSNTIGYSHMHAKSTNSRPFYIANA